MISRDEVAITITLHELDFVSLLRAARLTGMPREEIIRRAVGSYLVSLQKEGLDLGIVLPAEPKPAEDKKDGEKVESGEK